MEKYPPAPLPWDAGERAVKCWDHGHAYTVARIDPNDKFTAESRPEFAAYIATACNSYRDLLDALKDPCMMPALEAWAKSRNANAVRCLENARAAIAKAEGVTL